ncbi:hypothetical protein N0Y54_14645 [Nostoc punctiforme UO1]|uniref:hypothetical protein n=1 Tax=Nostoc punctiforme TaxID=272131 RepID=UPI0030AE6C54
MPISLLLLLINSNQSRLFNHMVSDRVFLVKDNNCLKSDRTASTIEEAPIFAAKGTMQQLIRCMKAIAAATGFCCVKSRLS